MFESYHAFRLPAVFLNALQILPTDLVWKNHLGWQQLPLKKWLDACQGSYLTTAFYLFIVFTFFTI